MARLTYVSGSFIQDSAQSRVDKIKHLASPLATSCRYQSVREKISKYYTRFKGYGYFHTFTYFASA